MNRAAALYGEFTSVCKVLNDELHITPVLYGSLGLAKTTGTDFSPQDIDILVPLIFLENRWGALCGVMERLGYELADLREHEFHNGETQIGFSFMEDLKSFADIDYLNLAAGEEDGAAYYTLNAADYFKVYKKSSEDGYRRTKNDQKDLKKLKVLQQILEEKK
ncbi:hypothetical protein [Planococcus halotolerans]|uniref:Nucleotidyltransferase family protein n=1 Tax=Planococcus halotolerans TaxID=2233542 RepID=A0A365KQY0_9BACL|nr:hypothetical protein [Planococcus halotolerans]QHJ69603.1 hypothetical protein DNR44_002700 [Planococcus halotolerans]RAZ75551.1 hypothetical protein DP120_14405 [Planococcus halotolerans]